MASTATTRLRLEKQGTGENTNTWGGKLNSALDLIDDATAGVVAFSLSGSKTLTSTNYATDESRKAFINVTGGAGGTVTIPSVEKAYFVRAGSSGDVIITNGSNSVTVKTGNVLPVLTDGTNIYLARCLDFGSDIPKSSGTPTTGFHLSNKTYVDATIAAAELSASGTTLAAGMASFLASGTSAYLAATVTDETGTGSLVFATSPTLVTPILGTPTSGLLSNCTTATQAPGTNTTALANTAFVKAAVDALVSSAPGALDTLDELAAALGDDANFAATVTTALALKAPLASPAFTGSPVAPTQTANDNSTKLATTAYVDAKGYTQINTATPSAVASVVFSIPATYNDLLITVDGLSPASGTPQLQIEFSDNSGSNYDTAVAVCANLGAATDTVSGGIEVFGYRKNGFHSSSGVGVANSNRTAGSASNTSHFHRLTGGANTVRISWSTAVNFDGSGVVTLSGI